MTAWERIETITCTMPACYKLAKDSQIHHIHPYSLGGPTRQDNLTPLCRVHNGRNDDNPLTPPIHERSSPAPSAARAARGPSPPPR